MRLGLDLRGLGGDDLVTRAAEADRLGLWAVLIDGPDGTGAMVAAELAMATAHIHLAVSVAVDADHVSTLAEELSVLDHLSVRRVLVVADGDGEKVTHLRQLLAGEIVDGFAVAPPPAQTIVPVWDAEATPIISLSESLDEDRATIDSVRDTGITHAFATWTGDLRVLSRHLATRALTPDFPQITADHADVIAPL